MHIPNPNPNPPSKTQSPYPNKIPNIHQTDPINPKWILEIHQIVNVQDLMNIVPDNHIMIIVQEIVINSKEEIVLILIIEIISLIITDKIMKDNSIRIDIRKKEINLVKIILIQDIIIIMDRLKMIAL